MKPTLTFNLIFGLFVAGAVWGAEPVYTKIDYPGAASTQAWGINARGEIIGYYGNPDNSTHGFLLTGGHYSTVDYPGAAVTLLNGIDPRGNIVGEFGVTATSPHRGFILNINGVFTPIDYPGATVTSAIGINAAGEMIGFYKLADNVTHGFTRIDDRFTSFDFPGAANTLPNGISPQGDIVGGYTLAGVNHGFLLSNGVYTTIDPPGSTLSVPLGINDSGDICGRYRDTALVNHGFILSQGHYTFFDFPGASFTGANAIDPSGNVAGRYQIAGVYHGFLLRTPPVPPRYSITDLGVIGPAPAQPVLLAGNGLLSGQALGQDGAMHATLWAKGHKTDLGNPGLGGLNSLGFGVNGKGQVIGAAESSTPDTTGEDFCAFVADGLPGRGAACLPFLWDKGVMTPLPTLGGVNGEASWINNRGEIVGTAETTKLDPACSAPQKYQSKPVVWERGRIQELPTFGSDKNGYAFAINDLGQIAGVSGDCGALQASGTWVQARHALIWEAGRVTDLGNLGGTGSGAGIFALQINNLTQVVGGSDIPGDQFFHGFIWSRETGMIDVGTLPGDVSSVALGINDAGDVVGISFDKDFNQRAFLWRNGVMTDLNALIPEKSPLTLVLVCTINSHGAIAGVGVDSAGLFHGFIANPVPASTHAGPATPQRPVQTGLMKRRMR